MMTMLLVIKKEQMLSVKRKHRFWVHSIIKRRIEQGAFYNLVRELELDRSKYHKYFRMSPEKLEYILGLVGPLITRRRY